MSRILILDDDKAVLNCLLVQLTQARRFEVEALSDSTKAFDAIGAGRFDLVLLDMDMPVVTGMDVLRHVRHLAIYDVIARDYLVYEAPHREPMCALATIVAGALGHLGRAANVR